MELTLEVGVVWGPPPLLAALWDRVGACRLPAAVPPHTLRHISFGGKFPCNGSSLEPWCGGCGRLLPVVCPAVLSTAHWPGPHRVLRRAALPPPSQLTPRPCPRPPPQVGDVLYLPRGTIHCATAQQGGPSGHLTVSTYQRWSAADLLQYGVSVALANPALQPLLPPPLKAGLPPGFLAAAALGPAAAAELAAGAGGFGEEGTAAVVAAAAKHSGGSKARSQATAGDVQPLAAQLAAACRALANCLEGGEGLGPRLLTTAADAMADDFMRHRRGMGGPGQGGGGGGGSAPLLLILRLSTCLLSRLRPGSLGQARGLRRACVLTPPATPPAAH